MIAAWVRKWCAALAALSLVGSVASAGELPVRKVLPMELAQQAASAAVAACAEKGYRVSAAVVDDGGLLKAQLRADGAGPHTLDSSRRKAYTALSLRHATSALVAIVHDNPEAFALGEMNPDILILGGGLPIESDDQIVGGIGVGGAPGGDKDEACAQAGLQAITEHLR
jgi:uncharacterized protein GlcG (DUF336 family)